MTYKTLWVQNGFFNPEQILQDTKLGNFNRVVLLGQFEWEMPFILPEFVQELKSLNAELHLVHGSFKHSFYERRYAKLGIDMNNVHFWNTYLCHFTESTLRCVINYKNFTNNLDFKYPYISLNNRAHEHRCALIDELQGRDLIKHGVVTWHNFLEESSNYPFKHFDRKNKLRLDDDFNKKLDSFLIPRQYHESFLHVVAEATLSVPLLSEKTYLPILFKKPFVLLGISNINQCLQELGFVLYDELIDYSYDQIDNLQERTKKLVDNLDNIIGKNYKELYLKLQPKIEYNYNRFLQIISSKEFVPKIMIECYNETKTPQVLERIV